MKLPKTASPVEREFVKLRSSQITKSEFFDFLRKEKSRLESVLKTVKAEKMTPEVNQLMQSELDTGFLGVETMLSGIDRILSYTSDYSVVEEGISMVKRGSDLVYRAMEMNIQGYDTMLESMKDLHDQASDPFGVGMLSPY